MDIELRYWYFGNIPRSSWNVFRVFWDLVVVFSLLRVLI